MFIGEKAGVGAALPGSIIGLRGAEGRHAAAALRMRVGEALEIGDGAGRVLGCCVVGVVDRDGIDARVETVRDVPRNQPWFTVAQALPKGDRSELAVELLTEVGVERIVPWQSERCVTRWQSSRAARGVDRWRSVALAASKQARRPWLPEIAELHETPQLCQLAQTAEVTYVLDEEAEDRFAKVDMPTQGQVLLVVGPEGGLTRREVHSLQAVGGRAVRLGPSLLRTSTAGAVAAAVAMVLCARW